MRAQSLAVLTLLTLDGDRPLSSGEIFALFILSFNLTLGCLLLVLAIGNPLGTRLSTDSAAAPEAVQSNQLPQIQKTCKPGTTHLTPDPDPEPYVYSYR